MSDNTTKLAFLDSGRVSFEVSILRDLMSMRASVQQLSVDAARQPLKSSAACRREINRSKFKSIHDRF
ncbi:MAG: hypothetical protein BGP05_07670 [Rhizobiales bacterium 62-47]|nr:hypothetical protein [Hyphomicrobiales bacterium]OJY08701.1 MAG: hypothetical protein BGP05_07670 [Rhizobiales bacterium 62-47]